VTPETPLVARVVPDVTGLDKRFDYLVPDGWRGDVRAGTMVRVGLAGRRVGGWVVSVGPPDPDVPAAKLRPLAKVTGHGPSAEVIDLAAWASRRWAASRLRPFLLAASPPRAVPGLPAPAVTAGRPGPVDVGAARLLAAGGGVVRRPPAADPVPVVLAAAAAGPTLVVTPSVDQARLLGARLRRSGLSVAVVPRDWAAAAGGVDVVVGARVAAWAPMPVIGAVVVLDEHDEALQEERAPTWHARDVAVERARRGGAPCLLVSPAPTLTALDWAGDRLSTPTRNEERAGWPILEVVDRRNEDPWRRSLVSGPLIKALRDPDRTVVCVLNAPGRARRLACRSCRALQRCERCQAAVGQTRDGVLRCARCSTERPVVCQVCGSSAPVVLRPGVSGLRDELEAAAGRPVVEVTGESGEDGLASSAGVFVGTEAVLHRVPRADVVAFLDIDDELLAPRFRADEQALVLLARAARLLGSRADGGRLLVQTRLPHHEVLDAVLHADPGRLTGPALARRRELGLPPARALAVLSGAGAEELAGALRVDAALTVAGPADGRYLVRAADPDALGTALAAAPRPVTRVRIEVDPPRV
jgi:primosomal protein N' (replication factor Y) (superfamily II helicase)